MADNRLKRRGFLGLVGGALAAIPGLGHFFRAQESTPPRLTSAPRPPPPDAQNDAPAPLPDGPPYPLGLATEEPVQPGETRTIPARVLLPFTGRRLLIPSDISRHFVVDGIRCRGFEQFLAVGAVPAMVFDEAGPGVRFSMDRMLVDDLFELTVTNVGAMPLQFRAVLIGTPG